MKKYKSLFAILTAVVLLCTLIACRQAPKTETVTQAVTNANGEIVTDKNGDPVTEEVEAVVVTDANGQPVTEIVTGSDGKAVTKVENGEYKNVTQAVTERVNVGGDSANAKNSGGNQNSGKKSSNKTTAKATTKKGATTKKKATTTKKGAIVKPTAPSTPKKAWTDKVKKDSLVLHWSSVKCTGYEVQYSDNGQTFSSLKKSTKATEIEVEGLISNTTYTFRIRAYNENKGGRSVSKWAKTSAKTAANKDKRKITFHVTLPVKGNIEDKLIIEVDGDKYEKEVNLDGSTVTIKTDEKYKGAVKFKGRLVKTKSSFSGETDKEVYSFSLSGNAIDIIEGEDD
ncbi:MAG: fibronectin type III domain-containing protein [Eubacterium sp.]|nr:fibronectin type III domain-containing protein [Eubacterium sp.]MBR1532240.1 fibronectin type III domain-containing protein [Eubacterium sp.]